MKINKRACYWFLYNNDKLSNHKYRQNRHSASNQGEDIWHQQQPDMACTRGLNNMKSRHETVSTATTQMIRHWNPVEDLLTVYIMSVFRPTMEYACPTWSISLTLGFQSDMVPVQSFAMNIIYPNTPYIEVLANTQLPSLKEKCAVMWTFLHTNWTAAAPNA